MSDSPHILIINNFMTSHMLLQAYFFNSAISLKNLSENDNIFGMNIALRRTAMSDYIFLFDLDATITKVEILPEIAKEIGIADKMAALTEKTMTGELPFERSFQERVELLKSISVNRVRSLVADIPLNEKLADFIRSNHERCYVVTGNLDVWIQDLMSSLNLENNYYCSSASVENDRIVSVDSVLDKSEVVAGITGPFVAVGDGNNDAAMIAAAEVGIGFGGVRDIAPSVLKSATHAAYSEEKLCQFLKQLL